MAEPTLEEILGTGTVRLASAAAAPSNGLFIPDSVFTSVGLATPTTATAEGHLVALLLKAKAYLTQANFDANIDQSILVADGFSSFTTRGVNNDSYRTDQITVSLAKLDANSTLDPDDY